MSAKPKLTGLGIALGAAVGTALGVAAGHMAIWLAVGVAVGVAIGGTLRRRETSCPECIAVHHTHNADPGVNKS